MLKLLLVVALFALATYVAVRLVERRGRRSTPRRRGGSRPPEPRPLGPDDDPDFLRDLDRKRRHPEHPEDPEL